MIASFREFEAGTTLREKTLPLATCVKKRPVRQRSPTGRYKVFYVLENEDLRYKNVFLESDEMKVILHSL